MSATIRHSKAIVDTSSGPLPLHYARAGEGPVVFLLHGWLGSAFSWRHVMPHLADRFTVVAPDLRGTGDSGKPPSGYDAATMVDDLRALRDQIGLADRPALVLGHDMGAPPALLWGARHPDEIVGVVYLDEPLPGVNLDDVTRFARETGGGYWWFGFNHQPDLAELLWSGHEAEMVGYFMRQMVADPTVITPEVIAETVRGLRLPGGIRGHMGFYRDVFDTADQIGALTESKVTVPVLGIGGEFGIPSTAEQMGLVADDARGLVMEGVSHLVFEEKPAELAQHIAAFYDEIRAVG